MDDYYGYKGLMRTCLTKEERSKLRKAATKNGMTLVAFSDSILRKAIKDFEDGRTYQA